MKKNQAREFACRVKKHYDQYALIKEPYRINLDYNVASVTQWHLKLEKIGLLKIGKDKQHTYYQVKILPNVQTCLSFLYKYPTLPRNLYNKDWNKS